MAGLFFCLASAEGAGLLFCPVAIQPNTSVYGGFYAIHAVIPPTPQNIAHGFTGVFPTIAPAQPPANTRPTQAAIMPPAPRWSVPQRRSASGTYQIPAPHRTLYNLAQPPYYNKVYKGATVRPCYRSMPDGATHRRPCQPGGVSMLPTPGDLQSGTGQQSGRTGSARHPSPGGAVQQ